MRWQRPARLAVGAFGVACAVVVYLALGERSAPAPLPPIQRIDPSAVAESVGGFLIGLDEDFELRYATMATYEDGTTRLTGVQITTPDREGRSFVVTAARAHETSGTVDRRQWELEDDVRLRASDGFELATDRGSFDEAAAIVRAAGDVTFGKGRMSGSGRGMAYDLTTDVLRVSADAQVQFAGDAGAEATRATASTATLDRPRNTLRLERDVLVVDPDQVMRADEGFARLSPEGGHVTFVELRGGASVEGGAAVDAMRAHAIDLDYTEDGASLERATLEGDAAMALVDGAASREFSGEHIDVEFAGDGAVGRLTGHTGVTMVLPASDAAPARRIESSSVEAVGRGGSLGDIRFTGSVVFREETGGAPRVARSRALAIEQARDGSLVRAVFTGDAVFEDGDLSARAAAAAYEPARQMLVLSGTDARGGPSVEDARVIIDARSIAIALDARRVDADGNVKTAILPERAGPRPAGAAPGGRGRRPGLLEADQTARITAATLAYQGETGRARYTGGVRLWQKETDVRADTMDIDLEGGDLTARGNARAALAFESGRSEGEGAEIAYDDGARRVTYAASKSAAAGETASPARVTGPQGDLRAALITVFLEESESRLTRLTAEDAVEALLEGRRITGAHLDYRASDDRYVVTGSATTPVRVRLSDPCREMLGSTLIYSRAADTMHVDGSEVSRTRTTRGDACR